MEPSEQQPAVGLAAQGSLGAHFLAREFRPSRIVGVDSSKETIRFCERTYEHSNIAFACDNAMNLSYSDGCFDVVYNIESSYCYADKLKFFEEAYRVLREGGSFHYADNYSANAWPDRQFELTAAGFVIESVENISAGVLRALEADEKRRELLIQRLAKYSNFHPLFLLQLFCQ